MENMYEFINKGIDAKFSGYKLGALHGKCWGVILGVIISLAFAFGWTNPKLEGQPEHTMLIFACFSLFFAGFWGNPSPSSGIQNLQEHYGTSRLYNDSYTAGCVKWIFTCLGLVLMISSWLSFYYVIIKPWGYVTLIITCLVVIISAFYIFIKSPSSRY